MDKKADPLSQIRINSPCHADWDSMNGNERVRFCDHCQLSVHHLSGMTQKEVFKLILRSQGRLCVRYKQSPDGGIQTASLLPARLHQIKRRASRIAAGAFTAALSLSSTAAAAAQPGSSSRALAVNSIRIEALSETTRSRVLTDWGATITGHVVDPQGAAVAGSLVTLTNEQTGLEQTTTSGGEGEFSFQMLEAGTYMLKVEQAGFKTALINIVLNDGYEHTMTVSLDIGSYVTGLVVVTVPSSPLVKAAMDNDMAALKELLEAGADVNAMDENYNLSALMVAVAQGNLEIVQALLWAGAEVNARGSSGQTALMNVSERTSVEVVKALLAAGAEIDAQDDEGDTALIALAAMSNVEALKALLFAGASANTKNNKGETALIVAAGRDIIENVKALIDGGANVYERDEEGETVLTRARQNKNRQMIKLLRTYGAIEYPR